MWKRKKRKRKWLFPWIFCDLSREKRNRERPRMKEWGQDYLYFKRKRPAHADPSTIWCVWSNEVIYWTSMITAREFNIFSKHCVFLFQSMRLSPKYVPWTTMNKFFPCYLQNNHDSFETVSNGDKFRIFSFFFPFTFVDWIIYFTSIVYYSSYLNDLNNRFRKRKIDGFSKEYSF